MEWRERQAREKNRPRGRVLKDRSCYEIARLQPDNNRGLSAIDDVGPATVRKNGDKILALIKQGQAIDDDKLPLALPKPLPPANGTMMKRLKAHVAKRAGHLAAGPTQSYAYIKEALRGSFNHTLADQLVVEAELQGKAGKTRDFAEGVMAFMEKRPAKYQGR